MEWRVIVGLDLRFGKVFDDFVIWDGLFDYSYLIHDEFLNSLISLINMSWRVERSPFWILVGLESNIHL